MPSLKSKVLNFLKSFLIPAACEECAKHDRQYEISCETCVEAKKKRLSDGLMSLSYH